LGDEERFDIVVVAHAARAMLERAFNAAAPGAVVTSVAPTFDGPPDLETRSLYHRGVTWIIGRPDCRHGRDGALAAWAHSGFQPNVVPTEVVAWNQAPEAWSSDALYVAAVNWDHL
jgi:alcohol dehydrogenase